ncbi:Z1 domain-containing protein [Spiroplasma endosymbiont of Dioctria linearis]|uniref:Z1 domain-containing protein n=1 Tax=Spiroplasma endosymbiont of Dioctria linearis TaxID=3066290 RepID=UPI00313AAE40
MSINFIKNFEDKYTSKIGKEGVSEIISKANEIIEECIDEKGNTKNSVGVIVGKVQSGKTSNFLGIISLAFDKGFDTVLLIGGWDNTLLDQNYTRAEEVFGSVKEKNSFRIESKVYQTSVFDSSESITSGSAGSFFDPKNEKKVIVTILKQHTHFKKVIKAIKDNKNIFDNRRVLIIDDEGDQASLDGNFSKKENQKNKDEPKFIDKTKLNKQIIEMTEELRNFSYLTVTATPYANFLLAKQEELSPKFIKLTKPGKDYIGLTDFHLDDDSNFIELIDDIDAETFESDKNNMDPPISIRKAISYFIISIINATKNKIELKNYEMLVHIERNIKKHEVIKSQLDKMLLEYKKCSEDPFDAKYLIFKNFVNLGFEIINNRKVDLEKDREFIENFSEVLGELSIQVINGTKNSLKIKDIKDPYVIYIGSDLLQRGVTLENLLVTYITRIAKKNNVDTVLQRARWFGYRKKILDYVKVFTTPKLKEMYSIIANFEESLWQELYSLDEGEIDTQIFLNNLIYSLPKEERLTRRNVAKVNYVSIKKWQTQKKYKETNNLEWIFCEELKNNGIKEVYNNSVESKYREFLNWEEFSKEINIDQAILEKIDINFSHIFKDGNYNSKKVKTILIRSDNEKQERKVWDKDLKFTLPAAGKRSYEELNEKNYFGDSNLHKYVTNKDKILIVIYKINFKDSMSNKLDTQIAYNVYLPGIELEGFIRG